MIRKLGSCGVVAPGVELAVFDDKGNKLGPNQEGELFVRRNQAMFDGYFGDKEKTAKSTAAAAERPAGRVVQEGRRRRLTRTCADASAP